MSVSCHICRNRNLKIFDRFSRFRRVTSDCKPWKDGGELAACLECGTVQAVITPQWREDARRIYQAYEVYHQGGGAEQAVFDATGVGGTRSSRLVARLSGALTLPPAGRLLDIGCGNGTFLRAFAASHPGWSLSGAEFDAKHLAGLKEIPGFHHLHTGSVDRLEGQFELIALVHTLEHIEAPVAFLDAIRKLLAPNGCLFIQVPHYRENPFELMTADHASHFDADSITTLLARAGFHPTIISTDWVGKELTVLATVDRNPVPRSDSRLPTSGSQLQESLDWLTRHLEKASAIQMASKAFGLFGSSIAATWVAVNLSRPPEFFVDEDPARAGRTHLCCPILLSDEVQAGSDIFVALQPVPAASVMRRHSRKSPGRWQA